MDYQFNVTLHPWGPDAGVVEIDTAARYGYWERRDGSEGGGLWFDPSSERCSELIDFDGAFMLPRSVVSALRAAGFVLDESFDD